MRAIYSRHSLGRDLEEALRPSAALRRRVAEAGFDVTLRFQTVESCINGADGNFAPYPYFYLLPNLDAVGPIRKSQKCEENNVFEFTEVVAT